MPTVIPTVSRDLRPLWVLIAGLVMTALLLLVMGAQASDTRGPQSDGATATAMAPAGRTAPELEWNTREDLKASAHVGLPGIY